MTVTSKLSNFRTLMYSIFDKMLNKPTKSICMLKCMARFGDKLVNFSLGWVGDTVASYERYNGILVTCGELKMSFVFNDYFEKQQRLLYGHEPYYPGFYIDTKTFEWELNLQPTESDYRNLAEAIDEFIDFC